jgi:hyperosmotically inducible periplasmic protein
MRRSYFHFILVAVSLVLLSSCQQTTPGINQPMLFTSPQSNDERITTAVLESMLNNEYVSNLKIHVVTQNSVVMLSGYVKTIRQSDTSEEIARRTPGVKSVVNNIIVRK